MKSSNGRKKPFNNKIRVERTITLQSGPLEFKIRLHHLLTIYMLILHPISQLSIVICKNTDILKDKLPCHFLFQVISCFIEFLFSNKFNIVKVIR